MTIANDTRNEDWIKTQHWDLPTDPRAFPPGELARLAALPAGEAMPANLRATLRSQSPLVVTLRGDSDGHDFHGNQWTGGKGGGDKAESKGPREVAVPTKLADVSPALHAEIVDRYTTSDVKPPADLTGTTWHNAAAWDVIQTPASKALDDPKAAYPERYQANKGFGVSLKMGETQPKLLPPGDGQQPPRIVDITPTVVGMSGLDHVVEGSQRSPDSLYRVMSTGEYDQAVERGYIQTDARMNLGSDEGTVTSLYSTGSFYAPGTSSDNADYRIARIDYHQSDGWRLDTDGYVKTDGQIPMDHVAAVTEPIPNLRAQRSLLQVTLRGDSAGHDFHGNQWTGGMGGGEDKPTETNMPSGAFIDHLLANKEGFTVDPATGNDIKTGISVGIDNRLSAVIPNDAAHIDALKAYRESLLAAHDANPNINMGGWLNHDTNSFVLDNVEVFPSTVAGFGDAWKTAQATDQIAIFHLDSMTTVPTGGSGTKPPAGRDQPVAALLVRCSPTEEHPDGRPEDDTRTAAGRDEGAAARSERRRSASLGGSVLATDDQPRRSQAEHEALRVTLLASPLVVALRGDSAGHDFHGNQWTGGMGGGDKGDGKAKEDGSAEHPIHCHDNLDRAAELIGQGLHVTLDQPAQVATLLDKMAGMARDAQAKGEKAPNYNLCNCSVEGSNLFCSDNIGVPRVEMPQLGGTPVPGSDASKLPANDKGEVNASEAFVQALRDSGVKVENTDVLASHLRASQNELVGTKVGGMMQAIENGTMNRNGSIFVTRDNYVLDGHHSWAAQVGVASRQGALDTMTMPVVKIDMDIGTALSFAQQWTQDFGIATKTARSATCPDCLKVRIRMRDLPLPVRMRGDSDGHDFHGNQWTGGHGGGDGEKVPRLSPASGDTVKTGHYTADLKASQYPQAVQEKMATTFAKLGVTPEQASANLTAVFEKSVGSGVAAASASWYQNAHDFNYSEAARTGANPQVVTAITAVISPGSSWSMNQTATTALLNEYTRSNEVVSPELRNEVNAKLDEIDQRTGTSLTDYRIAEGATIGQVLTDDTRVGAVLVGKDNNLGMRSYDGIMKGVALANANDPTKIDDAINGCKPRSFYNNMDEPASTAGDVTIDSHMFDAIVNGTGTPAGEALMGALHGSSSLISSETGSPKYQGAQLGVYPMAADIVRSVTDNANATHAGEPGFPMMPSQVQASIWQQQVNDYPIGITRKLGDQWDQANSKGKYK